VLAGEPRGARLDISAIGGGARCSSAGYGACSRDKFVTVNVIADAIVGAGVQGFDATVGVLVSHYRNYADVWKIPPRALAELLFATAYPLAPLEYEQAWLPSFQGVSCFIGRATIGCACRECGKGRQLVNEFRPIPTATD